MSDKVKLGVLVINSNDLAWCKKRLKKVKTWQKWEVEVFVLDNGCDSNNLSKKFCHTLPYSVHYSVFEEKNTISTGYNWLFSQARLAKCSHILLASHEQGLCKNHLRQMLLGLRDKKVLGVGFWVNDFFKVYRLSLSVGSLVMCGLDGMDLKRWRMINWYDQDVLMIKTQNLGGGELLDNRYYWGFSLRDLCWKLSKSGGTILNLGNVEGKFPDHRSNLSCYFATRNEFLMCVFHLSGDKLPRAKLIMGLWLKILLAISMILRWLNKDQYRLGLAGIRDGKRLINQISIWI